MARGGGGGGGGRGRCKLTPPSLARGGGGRERLKVTPNLARDPAGTRLLNLAVLRRLDPAVADILITAAHVALYSFDVEVKEWSRKGVDGSLFVVKRNTQPRFQFVVMNRRNTDNLVEDLLGNFVYQVEGPYIMYRNAAEEITGIWFYNPQECKQVAHLFSRIQSAFSRTSPKVNVSAIESEFEEPEAATALPSTQDTIEEPTSYTMIPMDIEHKFLSAPRKAVTCVGATTYEIGTVRSNQSVGMVRSCGHGSPSSILSESPALHGLLPLQTSSIPVMPLDAHTSSTAATFQPAPPVKPFLFPPETETSSDTTSDTTSCASPPLHAAPPLHPSITIQQWESAPSLQPYALPTASAIPPYGMPLLQPFPPPYGMPLLQPFPPPNPSPLLTPAVCRDPVLISKDAIRAAIIRLSQNDDFIDLIYREMLKEL